MWDSLIAALRAQLDNQLFAGGLALGLLGLLATLLRKLPGMLWAQTQRALVVTAVIDSRNDLFPAFVAWLNDQTFGQRTRWFSVIQAHAGAEEDAQRDGLPSLIYSPAPGFHFFWHAGRLMWLKREISMNLQVIETVHLGALLAPRRAMESLLEAVVQHASAKRVNRLSLYAVDRWGDNWQLADTKPLRKLESVVLDEGVTRRLLDDVHGFFGRRDSYAELGIPWRRGYLFYGPPGTGKTSVAFALAAELKLKLCTLSLTNPKLNDHTLADLLQRTPARSLILLEDIDAFFTARQKLDARIEVSFSGLLNALDGVGAQEGRIVVLTTNHREALDPALIRPGRIDVEIRLGNATPAQLRSLFLRFHPQATAAAEQAAKDYTDGCLSPAQIQQALLAADSPDDAVDRLRGLQAAAPSGSLDSDVQET